MCTYASLLTFQNILKIAVTKKIILILFLLNLTTAFLTLRAQVVPSIQWEKSLGGSESDKATSVEQTFDGGFIVAGYSRSNDGDVSGNHGGYDYCIMKLDQNGLLLWQRTFGGSDDDEPNTIHETSDSGYIIAGYTFSSDGDVTVNHGGEDYWIVKLNKNGDLDWQKSFGGNSLDEGNTILPLSTGGYLVAGTTHSNNGDVAGNHGGNDYWILKLNSDGNLVWQRTFGGSSYDVAHAVAETTDDKYIIQGWTKSTDGDVLENHGSDDFWILKLDTNGDLLWQKSLGGMFNEEGHYIQQLPDGGFIAGGYTNSNDNDVSGNHGSYDYWITRLDSVGNLLWQKCLGGSSTERSYNFDVTSDGGCIISGYSESNDGDVTVNYGVHDFWIAKLNAFGDLVWQESLGGSGIDIPYSIQQTSDNGFIIAGGSESNDGDVTGNHGQEDFWIMKLTSDLPTIADAFSKSTVSLFPNPVHNELLIKIYDHQYSIFSYQPVRICNAQGMIISLPVISIDYAANEILINTEKLSPGMYFIQSFDHNLNHLMKGKFIKV